MVLRAMAASGESLEQVIADRRALAMAVSAGFTAPMLGKKLVSTTYRLSTSWACSSRRGRAGRVAPEPDGARWWATPAIGISFLR
jgi:hypothetical protein